jgi:hypothetical protein
MQKATSNRIDYWRIKLTLLAVSRVAHQQMVKFSFGSRAEINHPLKVGSGSCHKTVIHQVQIAMSLIAGVGQVRNCD